VESQRVALYKRIVEARTLKELEEITEEIRDRYGEVARQTPEGKVVETLPEPVENLLAVAAMRILGRRHGIEKIIHTSRGFKLQRANIVQDYADAVRRCIRNGQPEIYIENPNCFAFEFHDWQRRPQTREALRILESLGAIEDGKGTSQ
jgi:transcription-repair coupling factor (superfamily II helicase)